MMLIERILATLQQGRVLDVRIGLHWTAVVVEVQGERRCGLASTLADLHSHEHGGGPLVPEAGRLQELPAGDLAALARSERPTLASVGVAAMNALLPEPPLPQVDVNAEQVLAERGRGKVVAMVGHFPFAERLRGAVGELHVLELRPRQGDLPARAAPQVLPRAEVVAITAMTLANHTLEGLLRLCRPQALVLLIGPSTPFSPLLFDHGVDLLAGAMVTQIEPVLRTISQGGDFRQVHRAGVRLVTLPRPGLDL